VQCGPRDGERLADRWFKVAVHVGVFIGQMAAGFRDVEHVLEISGDESVVVSLGGGPVEKLLAVLL